MIKNTIEDVIYAHRHELNFNDNEDVSVLAAHIRDAIFTEMKQCLDNVLETRCYGIPG